MRGRPALIQTALAIGLSLAACSAGPSDAATTSGDAQEGPTTMRLTSEAFQDGGAIPARYTCDGEDVSPPLAWDGVPDGTQALAILVEDPDARGFVHWVLADIPGEALAMAEGEGDAVGTPGRNDFRRSGWAGPCPPSGEHRYVFTLYALSQPVGLPEGTDAGAVRSRMEGHVMATATLTGVYRRNR